MRVERLFQPYKLCKRELCKPEPKKTLLKSYSNEASVIKSTRSWTRSRNPSSRALKKKRLRTPWLHYMEVSVESTPKVFPVLETQVTPEMKDAQPRVMDTLISPVTLETFSPSAWNGLKIPPVSFEVSSAMPASMVIKARAIRPDLYERAKKEINRLVQYCSIFMRRTAIRPPPRSPLHWRLPPKATNPFIRFCGNLRRTNEYTMPQHTIPAVANELATASQFKGVSNST